jgi:hypothetical protein
VNHQVHLVVQIIICKWLPSARSTPGSLYRLNVVFLGGTSLTWLFDTRDTPPFQEALTGYGQKIISWIKHLSVLGFKMFRIGDGFCVHVPRGASTAKTWWGSERKRRRKMRDSSAAFERWMQWRNAHSNISDDNYQNNPLCKNK